MYSHIHPQLIHLDQTSADIEASVLVSVDGLIMTSTLPYSVKTEWNTECLGTICAGAILLGQHTSERCASGQLEQVLIRCTRNHILMTYAGDEAILAVITKHDANLELIFLDVKRIADKIMLMVGHTSSVLELNNASQQLLVPTSQLAEYGYGRVKTA